jgi:hypothetical protein
MTKLLVENAQADWNIADGLRSNACEQSFGGTPSSSL